MKRISGLVLLAYMVFSLTGCNPSLSGGKGTTGRGGRSGGGSGALASGNWDFYTTSGAVAILGFGGSLNVSGSTVTGDLLVYSNDGCFPLTTAETTQPVSGTISNGSLPLTVTAGGTSFTLNLTIPSGTTSAATAVDGTYSAAGGCENGISGNLSGQLVSGTIGGTWVSTVGSSTLTLNFATSTTPNSTGNLKGAYSITPGTFTLTGPLGCTVSNVGLNTTNSFNAGRALFLDINDTENSTTGAFEVDGIVNDVTAPTSWSAKYSYLSGGNCLLDSAGGGLTFTKQ